jgi:hypothetical protein
MTEEKTYKYAEPREWKLIDKRFAEMQGMGAPPTLKEFVTQARELEKQGMLELDEREDGLYVKPTTLGQERAEAIVAEFLNQMKMKLVSPSGTVH